MNIEDLDVFDFEPKLEDGGEIKCPSCNEWSAHTEWNETEIYCEDCGSHYAMQCPKCEESFDHVYTVFESRKNEE